MTKDQKRENYNFDKGCPERNGNKCPKFVSDHMSATEIKQKSDTILDNFDGHLHVKNRKTRYVGTRTSKEGASKGAGLTERSVVPCPERTFGTVSCQ